MFETWKLNDFAPGEGLQQGAQRMLFDDRLWIDIPVPGDVHRTLQTHGRIEDPFYDRNELKCRWMEDREWWYRLRFYPPFSATAADECLRLIFHGLDTFASVWLNGECLGQSQNMFRDAVFDVTSRLKPDQENVIAVCFDRPSDHVPPERLAVFSAWGRNPERVFMRKAQFGFGWDWGPRLPTIGIWRPVELRRLRRAALRGVHFKTIHLDREEDTALIAVRLMVERFAADALLTAHVVVRACGAEPDTVSAVDQQVVLERDTLTRYFEVKHPRLWWTHDLGDPHLYQLTVTLNDGDEVLDTYSTPVGIRTIILDQSPDPDERGTRFFRVILNDVAIFARGADWIPADSFVGAIPDQRYQDLLKKAKNAHMNMLRVWGGGIYEHDVFYETCDQLGILVWQDFMFACAMYPDDDPDFVREVEAEATYQVERLRNHAALALWCGNNENQWIHEYTYWDQPDYPVPGALFYHDLLPRIVAQLDGQTPYWFGSPFGGSDHSSMDDGNRHNWQVWHGNQPRHFGEPPTRVNTPEGVSYLHYATDRGRFISEYGMHAAPVLETLRRVLPPDQLYHHSESMDHHNKDNPKNKGDNLMMGVTGLPANLEEYIDFSMIAQAEGLKFAIEHFRRRKPHCSGSLFWQLNDCWPGLSWSVIDYHGVGKAGYYFAQRAYAPVLASFKAVADGSVELWLTNDTLAPLSSDVTVRCRSFEGETIWVDTWRTHAAANKSALIRRWGAAQVVGRADQYLSVCSSSSMFAPNRHFFTMIKDLQRTPTAPTIDIQTDQDRTLVITLGASRYAYFVHISVNDPAAVFSDNYVDIEPGETKVIRVTSANAPLSAESVRVRWR